MKILERRVRLCGLVAVADDSGNWVLHCCSLSVHPVSLSCSPLKPREHRTLSSSVASVKTEVFVAIGWVLHAFLGGVLLWPV